MYLPGYILGYLTIWVHQYTVVILYQNEFPVAQSFRNHFADGSFSFFYIT